jgi:hypothetical protein
MAEADEPKKETTRISLPPRRGDVAGPEDGDTVRINLPARPPTSEPPLTSAPLVPKPGNVPIPRPPVSQVPLPKPPGASVPAPRTFAPPPPPPAAVPPPPPPAAKTPVPRPMGTATAAPASAPAAPPAPGAPATTPLAKDTARINILPDPPKPVPVKMSKTQPLITTTATVAHPTAPVTIAPAAVPQPVSESIPASLCWGLLLVSAAILIIEIWNYIS